MKYKKIIFTVFIYMLILTIPSNSSIPFVNIASDDVYADGIITIYASDGRTAEIYESDTDDYLALGWFRSFEEVTTTVYAPDGRSILVYNSDLPAYLSLGWYDSYDKITSTLYAPDGRTITVYNADVPAYLSLGWYRTYDEVTTTLYAEDGRVMTVYKDEAPTYLYWGWYSSYEEVTETMYAPDGRTIVVYKSEVEAYKNYGWSVKFDVDPSKPMVALTFDDGPSEFYTKRIVDTLIKYNAKATFFVVGDFLRKNPQITKYACDNGMEIGNHTYTHADLSKSSAYTIQKEVNNNSAEIQLATGSMPTLFRPPYGSINAGVKENAGMPLILWSIDTLDWKSRNADSVYNTVAGKVKDGDIILMHDLYKSTADAVDMIVPYLVNNGFQIVDVSTLARCRGYTMQNGGVYNHFR